MENDKLTIRWEDRLCLYSNGNFIKEFADEAEVEDYIFCQTRYFENQAEEIKGRKYTLIPSKYALVRE